MNVRFRCSRPAPPSITSTKGKADEDVAILDNLSKCRWCVKEIRDSGHQFIYSENKTPRECGLLTCQPVFRFGEYAIRFGFHHCDLLGTAADLLSVAAIVEKISERISHNQDWPK